MLKKITIKDVVLIALLTTLYFVFYGIAMMAGSIFGLYGHSIGPGIAAFLAGSIFYFMNYKIGKFGQFLILQAIVSILFLTTGMGHAFFIIIALLFALFADLISSRKENPSVLRLALSSGLLHIGQSLGVILPIMFATDSYKEHLIAKGKSAAEITESLRVTTGWIGISSTVIVFVLAFAGIYLGYFILRKHLHREEDTE